MIPDEKYEKQSVHFGTLTCHIRPLRILGSNGKPKTIYTIGVCKMAKEDLEVEIYPDFFCPTLKEAERRLLADGWKHAEGNWRKTLNYKFMDGIPPKPEKPLTLSQDPFTGKDDPETILASTADLANTWARELGVKECEDPYREFNLRDLIDRLWAESSRRIFHLKP
jgi:hypothetical protein